MHNRLYTQNLLKRPKAYFDNYGTANGFMPDTVSVADKDMWDDNYPLKARRRLLTSGRRFKSVEALFLPPFLKKSTNYIMALCMYVHMYWYCSALQTADYTIYIESFLLLEKLIPASKFSWEIQMELSEGDFLLIRKPAVTKKYKLVLLDAYISTTRIYLSDRIAPSVERMSPKHLPFIDFQTYRFREGNSYCWLS